MIETMDFTHIFLVGPRGAGKTTVGKLLGKRLLLPFEDTDAFLQHKEGRSVHEIVRCEGWSGFRLRESTTLRTVTNSMPHGGVIATGGGIVLDNGNCMFMRSHGTVFYLSTPAEELAQRLAASPLASQRPPLTGAPLLEEITSVLAERHDLYCSVAHHIISTSHSPSILCEEIATILLPPEHDDRTAK